MRKHLILAMVIGAGLALMAVPGALAKREAFQVGNLIVVGNGGIVPKKLPKRQQAPVAGHLVGEIKTTDGSHPPALETLSIDYDKTLYVSAKGLPVCPKGRLVARSTADAKQACPDAIVGSGEAEVEVAFPESRPFTAKGPIYLFNGGVHGGITLLYVHTYVAVPVPTAVIATVEISRVNRGKYGLHQTTEIPKIAGGAGSATKFDITVDRKFTYKGKQQSYLTASCPTGRYYIEGQAQFAGGPNVGITHVLPCTPMG